MAMINCYVSGIFLTIVWYPASSMAAVAVCDRRTLDGCLQTISSIIEDNDNLIYRIKGMCSDNGLQATRCAIRELINCPDYLSKPTGHDMQLHFLEEITVQDQADACLVWNGTPDDVKDKLNRAYTSKWTEVCVMMTSYQITMEPDGSRDVCGYMNLNDKCALQTIHEQYPQYEMNFEAVMKASMVFSSCVEHKHDHNGRSGTTSLLSFLYFIIALFVIYIV